LDHENEGNTHAPRTPNVVTGFMVRYVGDDSAFTTFQTFQPVDGRFYKVESFSPVVFIPLPHFRIDTSIPDAPKVIREGREIGLNDAISQGFVTVADRWEKPIELPATA
jgi:hypothetical protein